MEELAGVIVIRQGEGNQKRPSESPRVAKPSSVRSHAAERNVILLLEESALAEHL